MLKEDGELESIIIELVASMGMIVRSSPQKGVRQDGVDIHAVGVDPDDGNKKNFLITIKQGNISRTTWDAPKQGVRESLNEIIDVYINNKLSNSDKKLPIKIITCCGGELMQDVKSNWDGFQRKYSQYEFDLWNGNSLSRDILKFLLNETIFFEEARNKMRRTLVVLSDTSYDLYHFKLMINELFFNSKWHNLKIPKLEKQAMKALSTVLVCLGMIYEYSKENNNLTHALMATEYCLLKCWHFIQFHKLDKNKTIINKHAEIFNLYFQYSSEYFSRIYAHCYVKNAITMDCYERVSASEVVFKQIGLISTLGLIQLSRTGICDNSQIIVRSLIELINNNGISGSPAYDNLTIEICLAVYFLALSGESNFIKKWFNDLISRFHFSYLYGKGFPIAYDSIDKLIEFEYRNEYTKEDMILSSHLLPTLAYWCAILDFPDVYANLLDFVESNLKKCCLQIWFPAKGIKDKLFSGYVGNEFGIVEAPIILPKKLEELRARLKDFVISSKTNSCFETDWQDLTLIFSIIASRHFRTPVNPFIWLSRIHDTH
ncbi:hypothetical protein [Legionella sp. 227]|uniref:hypothetical protein n=1 Tax=Legionella sp. 227 TaxID=3367288 RepID=UPI00370D9A3B